MAPAWAAVALVMGWANALTGMHGLRLWLMWLIPVVLGPAAVRCGFWVRNWYERQYGMVWTSEEEDGRVEILSLLHGEDETVAERRRRWQRRRFWGAVVVWVAFLLPGVWLHGLQKPAWVGFCYLFAMAPAFYLAPLILEPAGGSPPAMWRRGVYAAATLALLVGDLLYLDGRVNDVGGMTLVGGVMLLVCLQDHWLFTRLLRGGAQARGGCDE